MQQISIALKSLSARKAVAKSFSEEGKMWGGGCQLIFHFANKNSLMHGKNTQFKFSHMPQTAQSCAPWSVTHFEIKGPTSIMYVVQQVHCSLHQCSQKLMILIVMPLRPFHLTAIPFLIFNFSAMSVLLMFQRNIDKVKVTSRKLRWKYEKL
jgi:hypothetical protein